MKFYYYKVAYPFFSREGFLIQRDGLWSEAAPFPGRSRETLQDVFQQLKAVQNGWTGPLLPSVAFALQAQPLKPTTCPIALFLKGSAEEIRRQAQNAFGCTVAKIKLDQLSLDTAIALVKELKSHFRLRIDGLQQAKAFCAHFTPTDFEFIEDPDDNIAPFPMASDAQTDSQKIVVWKPMLKGIPQKPVVLSSTFETGVGTAQIALLNQNSPAGPAGIGTYLHLRDDILRDKLEVKNGHLIIPSEISVKTEKLTLC